MLRSPNLKSAVGIVMKLSISTPFQWPGTLNLMRSLELLILASYQDKRITSAFYENFAHVLVLMNE